MTKRLQKFFFKQKGVNLSNKLKQNFFLLTNLCKIQKPKPLELF